MVVLLAGIDGAVFLTMAMDEEYGAVMNAFAALLAAICFIIIGAYTVLYYDDE